MPGSSPDRRDAWFNGARPNGSPSANRRAIQSLFDAALLTQFGGVQKVELMNPGTYKIDAGLTMYSNAELEIGPGVVLDATALSSACISASGRSDISIIGAGKIVCASASVPSFVTVENLCLDIRIEDAGGDPLSPTIQASSPAQRVRYGSDGSPWLRLYPSGDVTGVKDTAQYNALRAQLDGTGGVIEFQEGDFYINGALVKGGYIFEDNNYVGGILTRGVHRRLTRIHATTLHGFIVDANDGGTGKSASQQYDFAEFTLIGPGKATAGSIGIQYAEQGNYQCTPSRCRLDRVIITDFEACYADVDLTNMHMVGCFFQNYVYAHKYGYNSDIHTFEECYFGESTTVIGSQSETAVMFGFSSPFRSSGITAHQGNQNFRYISCWFMKQLLAADIYDGTTANVTFENCYFERCVQYAKLGNGTSTQGPKKIKWLDCHFSLPYAAGETAAKFQCMHASGTSDLIFDNNRSDSSDGPAGGWIDVGATFAGQVELRNNAFPVGGSGAAWRIQRGSKQIVGANYMTYTLRCFDNIPWVRQVNGTSQTAADMQHYAYSPSDGFVYETWAAKGSGSDATAGDVLNVVDVLDASTHRVALDGWVKTKQGASGSKPTAVAALRGMCWVTQGGAGVADTLEVCLKSAADTYSWKVAATG